MAGRNTPPTSGLFSAPADGRPAAPAGAADLLSTGAGAGAGVGAGTGRPSAAGRGAGSRGTSPVRRHVAHSQSATRSPREVTARQDSPGAGGRGGPLAHRDPAQETEPNEKGPKAKRAMSPMRSSLGVPAAAGGPPSPMRKASHALASSAHGTSAGPEGSAGGHSWLELGEREPLKGAGREATAQEPQSQLPGVYRPLKPPSPRRGAHARPPRVDAGASLGQAVKLTRRPWVLLALIPAVVLWLVASAFILQSSQRSQMMCPSGAGFLTSLDQLCDGQRDCDDGSDEVASFCASFNCTAVGRGACPASSQGQQPARCIDSDSLCDGKRDCPGGADEEDAFCSHYRCGSTSRTSCPSGNGCLAPEALCDGTRDCHDGSDEAPPFCKTFDCTKRNMTACPGGTQCIPLGLLCDGSLDCLDGSDEGASFCAAFDCASVGKVSCPSTPGASPQCTLGSSLCTGVADCAGGGDEDANFCRTFNCSQYSDKHIRCPGDPDCTLGKFCDGFLDCPVGDSGTAPDEDPALCKDFVCPVGQVKCADGLQCVPANVQCNGYADCKDKSDEAASLCDAYDCRASGRVFCPGGKYCLGSVCDICSGEREPLCPDGSDQLPANCHLRNGTACPQAQ